MTITLPSTCASSSDEAAPVADRLRWMRSPWQLLTVAALTVAVLRSVAPIRDVDIYWHLIAGQELLRSHSASAVGTTWSFAPVGGGWTTTQWLSEVLLRGMYDLGGWNAIVAWRTAMVLLVAAMLYRLLVARRPGHWSTVVFAATLFVVSTAFQERPELFSLPFLIWLAGKMHRWLRDGVSPRVLPFAALTWLWANLHGYFILAPTCALLVGTLAATHGVHGWSRPRHLGRSLAPGLAALVAAAATPAGPRLLLAPLTFRGATRHVTEWQPTTLNNATVGLLLLILFAVLVAWFRRPAPTVAVEAVYAGALAVFAMLAVRDVPVTAILIAPVAVDALQRCGPVRPSITGIRERRVLAMLAVCTLAVGFAATTARLVWTPPLPASQPIAIAKELAAMPGEHRVLNDYNVAGVLLFFGGPRTEVAIDGRADRYANYTDSYLELLSMHGHAWPQLLAQLSPNAAVLEADAALTYELTAHRGWKTVRREGTYVLLLPPSAGTP